MAKLSIRCPGQPEVIHEIQGSVITIGRGRRSDISLPDPALSRSHCRLERIGMGYRIVDLGSQNGTKVNGRRIQCPQTLMSGDIIAIGHSQILFVADLPQEEEDNSIDPGQTILLEELAPDAMAEPAAAAKAPGEHRYVLQYLKAGHKKLLPLGQEALTIGRHQSCGLVLADPSVSACHARIEFEGGQYIIRDLGSTNGVLVNGQKVKAKALRPGMRIRLGKVSLGFKELVSRAECAAPAPLPSSAEEQSLTPPLLSSKLEVAAMIQAPGEDLSAAESSPPSPPLAADVKPASSPRPEASPPAAQSGGAAPSPASRRGLIIRLIALAVLLLGLLLVLFLPSGEKTPPSPPPPPAAAPDAGKKPAPPPPSPAPSQQPPPAAKPSEGNGEIIF
ncbi:MAG: FHA domain-containing protein [Planctomycetota bacterium]|nr:FHA domain-containing protein [Planctomycetota bacterium]